MSAGKEIGAAAPRFVCRNAVVPSCVRREAIKRNAFKRYAVSASCALGAWSASALLQEARAQAPDNPASALELPTVEVVAPTPLPGLGVPREQIPANVQAATDEQIRRQESSTLIEFMEKALPSVNINGVQGSPFQFDVNYRGFTASPRLGIAQGLSVYLDGVRMNEPFGDIVNWDLIPQPAIANLNLIPGSNPLFGLNTLGGALSLRSKSGEKYPGSMFEVSGGSFGRKSVSGEHGGSSGKLGWYVTGNWYDEDGWRDFAPSRTGNLFAKVGVEDRLYDLDLSVLAADSRLIGNQVTPGQFLSQRWRSIYTHPDRTENNTALVNLTGSRWLSDNQLVQGNLYYRQVKTREFNVDLNEITDARFGVVPFEDGPNDAASGGAGLNVNSISVNRLRSNLSGYGATTQYSIEAGGNNRLTLGSSIDDGRTDFRQSYQLGSATADRSGTATGTETESVNVLGRSGTWSLFTSGTLDIAPLWQLTASARFNNTHVTVDDRIAVAYPAPAQGLDSNYTYRKLNPALGITHNPSRRFGLFGGFNQGNRAPSPIELGCADRNAPCLLSNAVASDPFLKQVVARTWEVGARGRAGEGGWYFALYRTDLADDILFVSSSTSAGYFTNFGKTRRQGLEAGLNGRIGPSINWSAGYSLIDATFRSGAVLLAEGNSSRGTVPGLNDDEILVSRGNRIPGIPRHAFKLSGDWQSGPLLIGAQLVAFSSQFVRGNENNQHQAGTFTDLAGDTRTFAGSGKSGGYAVLNLNARYQIAPRLQLFGKVANVFDRRYTTGGILGENAFPNGTFSPDADSWVRDTFLAPGAPRAFFIGVRYIDKPERK